MSKPSRHLTDELYVLYTSEWISELAVCWLLKFSFFLLARRSVHWLKQHLQWRETLFFSFFSFLCLSLPLLILLCGQCVAVRTSMQQRTAVYSSVQLDAAVVVSTRWWISQSRDRTKWSPLISALYIGLTKFLGISKVCRGNYINWRNFQSHMNGIRTSVAKLRKMNKKSRHKVRNSRMLWVSFAL